VIDPAQIQVHVPDDDAEAMQKQMLMQMLMNSDAFPTLSERY
jgi:hypothetical protein